jgi:acyl-CoA synthetase (AMP-forming)/AMP-acid ligase II
MNEVAAPPRGDLRWRTIAGLARDAALRFGDAAAVVEGREKISFVRLVGLMDQAARSLAALGFGFKDRAVIWAPNGWRWIVAALGVHACGGIVVPVNTRYRSADLAHVLKVVRPRIVMLEQNFLDTDFVGMLEEAAGGDERPVVIRFDDSQAKHGEAWSNFMARGDGTAAAPRTLPDDDRVSDIIFTSGTTGAPRGVLTTHAQVLRGFFDFGAQCGLRDGDRYAIVNPFSHSFGYRSGWVMALMFGATVWPIPKLDVESLVELIERERITVLPGTPTLYQSLLDWPGLEGRDLSSLRLAWTGAMSIPHSLIEATRSRLGFKEILTAYALTETTAVATLSRRGDPDQIIATTSGPALPDIEVRIASAGRPLPTGEHGEIEVRGYNVMRGYVDDPTGTAEAIDAEGWLRTGDVGALDHNGYLSISGRLKDMLIVGGFNVYPAEVEHVLMQHPGVAEVAVIGIPDRRMGEVAFAFVVRRQNFAIDESTLIAWLHERIANFKVPRAMRFVDALPRNALGKVLKQELKGDRVYISQSPARMGGGS